MSNPSGNALLNMGIGYNISPFLQETPMTQEQLEDMTVADIKEYAESKGIEVKGQMSKSALIEYVMDRTGETEEQVEEDVLAYEKSKPAAEDTVEAPNLDILVAPENVPYSVVVGDKEVTKADIVKGSMKDSEQTAADFNNLSGEDKDAQIKEYMIRQGLLQPEPEKKEPPEEKMAQLKQTLKNYLNNGWFIVDADDQTFTLGRRDARGSLRYDEPPDRIIRMAENMKAPNEVLEEF